MFSAAFGPVLFGPGQQPPNPSGPSGVCSAPVQVPLGIVLGVTVPVAIEGAVEGATEGETFGTVGATDPVGQGFVVGAGVLLSVGLGVVPPGVGETAGDGVGVGLSR